MNRLTLADVKPHAARVLGLCETDTRVLDHINQAQERLMHRGNWVGTIVRYQCCVPGGCLTWPRQIEAIHGWILCKTPKPIRNHWYEFVGNGTRLWDSDDGCAEQLIDRGTAPAFDDIQGTGKKIKVYAEEDEGTAQILLQYWDSNGKWVRTDPGTGWVEGEYLNLDSSSAQVTANEVLQNGLVGVQKPVTNGRVLLYELDTGTGAEKPLAVYEPDETNPIYRRSVISGLENVGACDGSDTDCEDKQITVIAKLRHIDVRKDTDWLILQNLSALKLGAMAVQKEEQNNYDQAQRLWNGVVDPTKGTMVDGAIPLLEAELESYNPPSAVVPVRVDDWELFGAGGI